LQTPKTVKLNGADHADNVQKKFYTEEAGTDWLFKPALAM